MNNNASKDLRELAEIHSKTHIISEDPHERAIQLTNFCLLSDAVQKMGWHTHTSDWDWSAQIELRKGPSLDGDIYGDTFSLRNNDLNIDLSNSWSACVDFESLTHLVVIYKENEDEDKKELVIPVENLETITVYWE